MQCILPHVVEDQLNGVARKERKKEIGHEICVFRNCVSRSAIAARVFGSRRSGSEMTGLESDCILRDQVGV